MTTRTHADDFVAAHARAARERAVHRLADADDLVARPVDDDVVGVVPTQVTRDRAVDAPVSADEVVAHPADDLVTTPTRVTQDPTGLKAAP